MACPHGMPSPASCFTCMEDGPVEDLSKRTPGKPEIDAFYPSAKHEGHCPECNLPIRLTQPIYRMVQGERIWYIHADCIS
jgi:hypothetical protein